MRSRRLLMSDDPEVQDRRQRGREAQRRFRRNKFQRLAALEARNAVLEQAINQLYESFANFSNQISTVMSTYAGTVTLSSFRDTLETFSAVANHIGTQPGDGEQDVIPWVVAPAPSSAAPHSPTKNTSPDEWPEIGLRKDRPQDNVQDISRNDQEPTQFTSLAPPMLPLFMGNPLLTDDYWSPTRLRVANLPLWQRLFHHTMVVSQQHLDLMRSTGSANSAWLSRAHRFSLRWSTPLDLMTLTAIGLRLAAIEYEEHASGTRSRTSPFGPAPAGGGYEAKAVRYFDVDRYHTLGVLIRKEMASEGLHSEDIIDAEQVEEYLRGKGMVHYGDGEIHFKINADTSGYDRNHSTGSEPPMLVVIGMEKFIRNMIGVSLCLGNAIGYHQKYISMAIMQSVIRLVPSSQDESDSTELFL